MITNLTPYPAYKDSGVRWLGKVPEHWELMPVKRALRPQSCGNVAIKNTAAATPLDGYAPAFSASGQDVWLPRASHCGSALVLSAVGARCGKTFRADGEWGVVANTHILWPRTGQNRDFWWYVTNNEAWWDKAGAAQPFVRVSATLERSWVIPPLPEQTAIVRFLDYMDRRIRRFIRAKQKLIKLLEEYRQALIHQAVTGKIDVRTGKPYPAYKDSGVRWLGQVPAHWDVVPLKRLAWFKSGAGFPVHYQGETSAAIPFFKVSDMNIPGNEKYLHVCANTVSMAVAQDLGATVLPAGTIVFPKVGGALLTNKRRIAANQCCIDNNMMGCVVRNGNRDFLFLIMSYIDLGQIAKPGPVPAISEGEVREIRVALPSAPEQTAIVEYLDAQTAKLDAAIAVARREIELLREYRERLIADVVTGKVDVRGVAAQLPEEPPDQEAVTEEEEPVAEELATVDSQEESNGEE